MATSAMPSLSLRRLNFSHPWLLNLRTHSFSTTPLATLDSLSFEPLKHPQSNTTTTTPNPRNEDTKTKTTSFYPKRGQTLELECESIAYKGKGVCKVADTGFVLMCDRVLPGERFVGRVTRKRDNYAEVKKLKTLSPHRDAVEAPCEYALHCGGCKTQNLLYEAQVRAKEQQVRELVVHVGRFPNKELESIMKPIVPCDIQFHYRNKMEFSFGPKKWVPIELLEEGSSNNNDAYALGLHVPGFFDKILNVDICLLQSEPANKLGLFVQRNREMKQN